MSWHSRELSCSCCCCLILVSSPRLRTATAEKKPSLLYWLKLKSWANPLDFFLPGALTYAYTFYLKSLLLYKLQTEHTNRLYYTTMSAGSKLCGREVFNFKFSLITWRPIHRYPPPRRYMCSFFFSWAKVHRLSYYYCYFWMKWWLLLLLFLIISLLHNSE